MLVCKGIEMGLHVLGIDLMGICMMGMYRMYTFAFELQARMCCHDLPAMLKRTCLQYIGLGEHLNMNCAMT